MVDLTKSFINHIVEISLLAGKIILEEYQKPRTKILVKEDSSPVTEADLKANEIIVERLLKLDKTIPCLSEESNENNNVFNEEVFWAVDPLDGTKEFINQTGEFTVNISLINNNNPVFGVIYAPVKSLLYYASQNNGSYKINTDKNLNSLDKFKKIQINKEKNLVIKIIGSRSHSNKEFEKWVAKKFIKYEVLGIGSSLKFCLLAEGEADVYPRLGPTSEWDIAAGHIILEEAGGKLKSIDNNEILYNTKEDILNPHFIAYGNMSKID